MHTPRNLAAIAVAIAGALAACTDFTPPAPAGIPGTFAVNPANAHLNVGGAVQLKVTGSSGAIIWSSTADSVATVSRGKVVGVSSGLATIRAVSGTNHAFAQITVTLAAAITLSTATVTFTGIPAGALPDSQTVAITNGGQDPLTGLQIADITYGTGASGWLTATLTQTDAPSTLVLRPNTTALAAGSYTASVSLTASSVTAPPQIVTVTYTLTAAAARLASATALFPRNGAPRSWIGYRLLKRRRDVAGCGLANSDAYLDDAGCTEAPSSTTPRRR